MELMCVDELRKNLSGEDAWIEHLQSREIFFVAAVEVVDAGAGVAAAAVVGGEHMKGLAAVAEK